MSAEAKTTDRDGLKLGVAGVGSLGFHHARIARELDGVRMEGFFDPDPDRTEDVRRELAVESFPTLDALLEAVDAVVVASPTRTHADLALAAIERGVHVFIEKPIAATLEEADQIVGAAETSGVRVQVGHVERFNPALVAADPVLDGPLFIESHRLAPFTERGTDVAVVLDLMIHDVDLVASLVAAPIKDIQAIGVPILTESVDIANARISFANGAVANLTASRVSSEKLRKLRIFQRSGYMSLDLANGRGEYLRLKRDLPALQALAEGPAAQSPIAPDLSAIVERIPLTAEPAEPLRRELESFRDSILDGRPPVVSARAGRDALATALAIEARIMNHVADTRSS